MILTRTPFRVTLGGGGTDLPSFYEKHGGFICGLGIDKFMYVALNVPNADRLVRLHYSKSETVDHSSKLQHELAREALLKHGIFEAIEVASLADLPAGTGLGSSSCYLVGLLGAIRAYLLRPISVSALAEEACHIELDILSKPIGKQDQFMAAVGGLTELHISKSGDVEVRRIALPGYAVSEFISKTHLYYTNVRRETTEILIEQNEAMKKPDGGAVEESLLLIKEIGYQIAAAMRATDFDKFGDLMHRHWEAKKRLSKKITVSKMEQLYEYVRTEFGVLGGKVVGAGGGGFLMLYCPNDGRRLTDFMATQGMERLNYTAEFEGSRVLTNVLSARPVHEHLTAHQSNELV